MHLRSAVVHHLPRRVSACVRPRCPTPPRVVPAVHPCAPPLRGRVRMASPFMIAGSVRFAGAVCACVVSQVIYAARWPRCRPWFCPPWLCQRFLSFPGPSLLSTGRLRGHSGGPLGAQSPARTDSSIGCLRGSSGGPLGAGSPGHRQTRLLRCGWPSGCPIPRAH